MRFITEAVAAAGLPSWVTAIVLLFGALGTVGGFTGLAALLTMRRSGRKIEADTAKTLTETAVLLIKPLDDRINGLQAEVTDLREALNHRDQLAAEAVHAGIESGRINLRNVTRGTTIEAAIELTPRERELLMAGGVLPWTREHGSILAVSCDAS